MTTRLLFDRIENHLSNNLSSSNSAIKSHRDQCKACTETMPAERNFTLLKKCRFNTETELMEALLIKRFMLGVGKIFSRRAALTISRVVEGQSLLSRTAACYRRNCISSQFCEMFWQCGISARKNGGVSKKKKKKKKRKGHHLFVDGKCVIGGNCRL